MHSLLRNLRGRDLREYRAAELLGILDGIQIALREEGRWAYHLARWIEAHPELHGDPVCRELRRKLQADLDPHSQKKNGFLSPDGRPEDPFAEAFQGTPSRDREKESRNPPPEEAAGIQIERAQRKLSEILQLGNILHEDLEVALRTPDVEFSQEVQPEEITFLGEGFAFTGVFQHSREFLEDLVIALGGNAHPRITLKTRWLVVGGTCEPTWKYRRRGRKIEKAEELIARKPPKNLSPIQIVPDSLFRKAVILAAPRTGETSLPSEKLYKNVV